MVLDNEPWHIREKEHWVVGYFYTINTILGSGVLAMAWVYSQMGWGLAILCQLIASAIGIVLIFQLIETMSRMEAIKRMQEAGYSIKPFGFRDFVSPRGSQEYIIPPEPEALSLLERPNHFHPEVTERRFDMSMMARVLLGTRGSKVFIGFLFCFLFPVLVAYTSIFAASMASIIPIVGDTCNIYSENTFGGTCRNIYAFYVVIYGLFMVGLALIGMSEQVAFQVMSTLMRFIVFTLIVVTALVALANESYIDDAGDNEVNNPDTFNIHKIGLGFPIIIVATFFHTTVPNTVQFVKDKARTIPKIAVISVLTSLFLFLLLGVIVPFAINDVEKMITLNWRFYSAGANPSDREWWAYIVAYLVILLPVVDIMSVFPLISINLSDNMISVGNTEESLDKKTYVKYRLIASVPALLLALVIYDISVLLDIVGTMSLVVSGIFIPLFHISTKTIVPETTGFDSIFSSTKWSYGMILTNGVLFVVVLTMIIINIFS